MATRMRRRECVPEAHAQLVSADGGCAAWQVLQSLDSMVSRCADGNPFLGGPCAAGGAVPLTRTLRELPPHTQVRITARVHFIDNWRGESAFAQVRLVFT